MGTPNRSLLYLCGRWHISLRDMFGADMEPLSEWEMGEFVRGRQDAEFELTRMIAFPGVMVKSALTGKELSVDDVVKREQMTEMTPGEVLAHIHKGRE